MMMMIMMMTMPLLLILMIIETPNVVNALQRSAESRLLYQIMNLNIVL